MVQWLGLHALTAKGPGLIPGQGTKIPKALPKKKRAGGSGQNNLCWMENFYCAYVTAPKSGLSGDTETSVSFAWIPCIIAPSTGIFTQGQFQGENKNPSAQFSGQNFKANLGWGWGWSWT